MIRYVKETDAKEIIVGTEVGMIYRLQKEVPEKKYYPLNENAICKNMKLTTLEEVYKSLSEKRYEVFLDSQIAETARQSLEKMLELS